MQGTSTLTVYAGQTVLLAGSGALTIDNLVVHLLGGGALSAKAAQTASCELAGAGELYCLGSSANRGVATLPALVSIGTISLASGPPLEYATSYQDLPGLVSGGLGGFYVPPELVRGLAYLPKIVSSATSTNINTGDGSATLDSLISRGGDYQYGEGSAWLPPLVSFAYSTDGEVHIVSGVTAGSSFSAQLDTVIVLTSAGTIASSFTATREVIEQLLSEITGASVFSVEAELLAELWASMAIRSVGSYSDGKLGGRVWVVNMDTTASSQYDNYGFESFFTKAGISYGVAEDGIYRLDGDTDAGRAISGLLEMGRSDCGTRKPKKILGVYLGVSAQGSLYLKVNTDGKERTFLVGKNGTAMKTHHVRIPHTVTGSHWNFTLLGDFDLSSIEFKPMPLARRT